MLTRKSAQWQPDGSPCCGQCLVLFGLLVRRHHCRRCGMLVCHACAPYRPVAGASVRICAPCTTAGQPLTGTLAVAVPARVVRRPPVQSLTDWAWSTF